VPPVDPDLYVNAGLGFELRKPSHWLFLATPWAVNLRKRTALSNDELREVMEQASAPFVYAHLPHSASDSAFPTLQATCRVLGAKLDPEVVLPQLVAQLERQFSDLEILDQTAHAIVGGCKAILLRSCFTIRNAEGTEFRCLSRSYTLFASQLVFSVGLSCAAHGEYCVEDDIELIARSIRVRRRPA
jgi:hypothetical protein